MNYETIAAYLAGESEEAEKQAVESWRQASTENEGQFERWQVLWQASQRNIHSFKPDTAKAWQKINPAALSEKPFTATQQLPQSKNHRLISWISRMAAIVLLAIGLGWGLWKINQPSDTWIEKTSTTASDTEVFLADGTKVWLNGKSKLRYPEQFTAGNREIFLEGEAYFEVKHNSEKPFLIHTQGSVTQVLGTTFSVRSYNKEPTVEVNLVSGKVSFSLENKQANQKVMLQPRQKAVLNKASQTISVITNTDQNFLAWKTRKLEFEEAALSEALPALENYYGVDFTVSDSLLLNCRFTGTFNKAPISHVLEVFAFGSDISYRKQGNHYILSGKGCQ